MKAIPKHQWPVIYVALHGLCLMPAFAFLFSTTIADNIAMGFGQGTAIPAARARELEAVGALAAAVDLSTDPRVVEAAKAAGLAGIAVEAGRSFVLQQAETIARADELGLFIIGIDTANS